MMYSSSTSIPLHEYNAPDPRLSVFANQVPIRVIRVFLLLLHRLNRLFHPGRTTHCNRVGWDILGNDRSSPDCRAPANTDPRENYNIPSNPAVVIDEDRVPELYELLAREHACVMPGAENAHPGTDLDTVADDDEACIEDSAAV